MKEPDDELRQAIALFRYGVIADLACLPVGTPGTGAMMRAKAKQSCIIPGSTRTRIAAETVRGWITDYRRGGFEALYPKRRTDRDQPRRLPPEVAERLIALKTASPNQSVRVEGIDHPLAPSSRPIPDLFVDKAFAADPAMPRFFAAGRCDFGR